MTPLWLNDLGNVAVWFTTITAILFIFYYTKLAKWWKNPVGRTIVMLDLALLFALAPMCIARLADPNLLKSLGLQIFEVCDIFFIGFVMLTRIHVWHRLRRGNGFPGGHLRSKE